jgi:hypothetical protein
VKNASESYGAARLGDKTLIARVENDSVRPRITSFMTSDQNLDEDSLAGGRLFFGVDLQMAIIKRIQVRDQTTLDPAEIAHFEMTQSLLGSPDGYYYDILPLESDDDFERFISIAYHRSEVDKLSDDFHEKLRKPTGFKLDAVALARGYGAFCRQDQGELQVLLDTEIDKAVMAILHRGRLYNVGRLEAVPGIEVSPNIAARMASELKMTVSYQLSELYQNGVTVPLSRVILSGHHARNETLMSVLRERLSTEITLPHFHEGYFEPISETIDRYDPEKFLIPLGLAVE